MEKKKVSREKNKFRKFQFQFKKPSPRAFKTLLVVLGIFVAIWYISIPGQFTYRTEIKEGSIAREDIYAPKDFWVVDIKETKAARDKIIAESYRPIYNFNIQAREETLKNLYALIEKKALSLKQKTEFKEFLEEKYPPYLISPEFKKSLIKAGHKNILVGKDKSQRKELNLEEIGDLAQLKETLAIYLSKTLGFSASELENLEKNIIPNLNYNAEESENFRNELANSVLPKEKFISQGENIVRKGEKITAETLLNLEALDRLLARVNLKKRILGIGILILLVITLVLIPLNLLPQQFELFQQHLGLIGIIAIGMLFMAKCFIKWFPPIFIPVASGAMLIALLISVPLAIGFSFLISILASSLAGGEFELLVIFLLGSLVGILAVRRVRQRLDIFRAIILIGLVNMGTIFCFGLINSLSFMEIGRQIIWGWGNSLLGVGIVMGISPIFESLFKITSDINLLELSDLNRPILRRLMIEASGTYHHSLIVGNLAEAAAEKIKANSLLARVGSYYHDIGKLYKTEYFSENQAKSKSLHEKITPRMSSLVIAAHIKEGVNLAKENKLPQGLIDFIEQHHGTTLMWIFYQAALEQKGAEEIREEDFRYPGPKPQTREIAIVMLADAVEAASRTLDEPTPSRIRNLVNQIINDKFLDAQLEECNLTLRDLHEIGESFIYTLTGLFHVRIEYPQTEKKNDERRIKKKNGSDSVSLGEKNRSGDSKEIWT